MCTNRYQLLWETASNWLQWNKEWMDSVFSELDATLVERRHMQCLKHAHRSVKAFEASGNSGCHAIAKYDMPSTAHPAGSCRSRVHV